MHRRHLALPRMWLLTDERQGEQLWTALAHLPRRAGVIVRHYSWPEAERQSLARRIAGRGHIVAYAGSAAAARKVRARALYETSTKPSALPRLMPAHGLPDLVRARRMGAALVLLSPVFRTRSHPGARGLGPVRFGLLAGRSSIPVIALGGMTPRRFKRVQGLGASGWAAIDAWIRT